MADLAAKNYSYLQAFFIRVLSLTRPQLDAEAMRALAVQAAARSMKYAQDHPYATAFAALNVGLAPILGAGWLTAPLLNLVGFGPLGPIAGTVATWYQSTWLGPYISATSVFSMLQKWAMTI